MSRGGQHFYDQMFNNCQLNSFADIRLLLKELNGEHRSLVSQKSDSLVSTRDASIVGDKKKVRKKTPKVENEFRKKILSLTNHKHKHHFEAHNIFYPTAAYTVFHCNLYFSLARQNVPASSAPHDLEVFHSSWTLLNTCLTGDVIDNPCVSHRLSQQ